MAPVLSLSMLDDAVVPSYDDVPRVAKIFLSRTAAFLAYDEEDKRGDSYYLDHLVASIIIKVKFPTDLHGVWPSSNSLLLNESHYMKTLLFG